MKKEFKNLIKNKNFIIGFCVTTVLVASVFFAVTEKVYIAAKPETLNIKISSFEKIKGWREDNQQEALAAFEKSCSRILKKPDATAQFGVGNFAGTVAPWQKICSYVGDAKDYTPAAARKFFENNFTPYEVWSGETREGLFTGYYEPTLSGSITKTDKYSVPIYRQPDNLITVNLGDFKTSLKGEQIVGRIEGTKLIPYYNREQIENGVLANSNIELVWVDNAVDAFFLHIQGSGRVVLDNGEILRIGYASQNGMPYTAIGKALLNSGALTKENVSMQAIRAWLEKNPDKADDVMNVNASYIFFRVLDVKGDGPIGAEGISLTPERSLAVDRKKIPYGVPIWINTPYPEGTARIKRLMIAQDTGGAITGAIRGDFFWGAGEKATHNAGLMKGKGEEWILLPKEITVNK